MILPEKHVSLSKSYFGFGGILLHFLDSAMTVDGLWEKYRQHNTAKPFHSIHSFDSFILTLDYLHLIGAISQNSKGEIFRETHQINCQ